VKTPGQDSGQALPATIDWAGYLDLLVAQRGSLAALAEHLAAQRGYSDELSTIERGLRRLRQRGDQDGGIWGRRVLALFGIPVSVEQRLRFMGHYHTRFTDLPTPICAELIQPWNQPPWSESRARVWIRLAMANVALRRRQRALATQHLAQAARVSPLSPVAAAELGLVQAYTVRPAAAAALLDEVERVLDVHDSIEPDHRACLHARLIDQRAYPLNKPPPGAAPDHGAALALYESLPEGGPPFAQCRRHNGMGWTCLRLGDRTRAVAHGLTSEQQAGDGGSLRLRAMALNLLAHAHEPGSEEAAQAAARARGIAERLADAELIGRYR
jgi:hypothetical protein